MDPTIQTHVHSGIIPKSQKAEATPVPIDRPMDKENVVYTHKGLLFGLKKKDNSYTCYNLGEP